MKILIVEDEALIWMYLETLVMEFGHEVCAVATTARAAISQASLHLPDLILMDIRLAEGSSGIHAAREIHGRHGIRCIFLSGNLDEATRDAVRPYDPIAFLGKPVLPIRLQHALEQAASG